MPSGNIDSSEIDRGNKQNSHKYYEEKQSGGEGGIDRRSFNKKVVHLLRKPWRKERKPGDHLPPLYFSPLKREGELDHRSNLLAIVL